LARYFNILKQSLLWRWS